MREELERSVREPFPAEEVEKARQGLLNFRRLSRAQDDGLAAQMAGNEWLGRDFLVSAALDDAIARVTPAQVHEAWKRHIDPARIVWVIAGDFKDR